MAGGNLDLHGFVSPVADWSGIDKISNTLQKNNALKQQALNRAQTEQDKQEARQNSQSQFFTNYLDKKDRLTGTLYDSNTGDYVGKALNQAYQLSSQGASTSDIMMAVQPLVDEANTYQQKAKIYSENKKQLLDIYGKQKGYDVNKLSQLLDDSTFYTTDPKTGKKILDVNNADPSLQKAMQDINDNHLHEISTGEGIGDWAKSQTMNDRESNVITTDSHGNKTYKKVQTKSANWEVPEQDGKGGYTFVPKHDEAHDNQIPLQHEFVQQDGTKVKAPIRLLDDNMFYDLMKKPSARDYILGQVKQHISEYKDDNGKPIAINSPKAEMIAKAIAYDALKSEVGGVVHNDFKNTVSPQQIRINLTGSPYATKGGGGNNGSDVNINDVYGKVQKWASSVKDGHGAALNQLDADAQSVVLKFARDLTGNNDLGQADIYVKKESDGTISVKNAETQALIGKLDYGGTNLKSQPSVKEKRAILNHQSKVSMDDNAFEEYLKKKGLKK